jgi:hypothetical protein
LQGGIQFDGGDGAWHANDSGIGSAFIATVLGQKMLLNARAQKGSEITQRLQTSDWLTLNF